MQLEERNKKHQESTGDRALYKHSYKKFISPWPGE